MLEVEDTVIEKYEVQHLECTLSKKAQTNEIYVGTIARIIKP